MKFDYLCCYKINHSYRDGHSRTGGQPGEYQVSRENIMAHGVREEDKYEGLDREGLRGKTFAPS